MVDHIDSLNNFVFDDAQPNIEAPTLGVLLDTKGDNSYSDYRAYVTRWTNEIDSIRNLEPVLVSGRQLVSNIYVYRSVSRAMQAVAPTTTDETAMTQYYRNMYDILLPEVNKLRDMMRFVRTSQQFLRGVIAGYKDNEQRLSENFMMKLVELIDILTKLDVLKNSKIGLESDFQAYQSATSFLQSRDPSITNSTENHELVLFLGHQNSIINGLKTEVIKIEGYGPVISALLLLCIDMFESHRYITPEEKFCLLRVIPTCLYFLDNSDDPRRSLVKTKEHNVSHIQKILKRWPVVPLCGDLHVLTTDVLKDSPSFRSVPEFFLPTPKIGIQYSLKQTIPQARMSHNEFTAIWKDTLISLKEMLKQDKKGDKDEPVVNLQFSNELVNLTLRGFTLLGDWTSDLLAQMAYKYANPFKDDLALFQLTDAAENIMEGDDQDPDNKKEEVPGQGTGPDKKNTGSALSRAQGEAETPTIAYERAVKYNFQSTERFAMVEYMGLIKSLAGMMQNAADLLVPYINRAIHHDVQVFIQTHLRDLIRKFTKSKKKKFPQDELVELMNLLVDWKGGHAPINDPVLAGKKDPQPRPLPDRCVPPSQTQLEILRSILWGFINLRGNKDIYSKVFSKYGKEIKIFEEIFNASFFYRYLVDYSGTIGNASNIGDLWFREHFLEKSGSIQFSLQLSLPNILTNHVLDYAPKSNQNIVMMEYLLYPLSIYNDAATQALYLYQKRHLYDEVEAEVNLAFDELLYKLCSQIYTYYKINASSLLLDKGLAKSLEVLGPDLFAKFVAPPSCRYPVLFEQYHFQLLGRSLDLNRLISQRMNSYFRENLQYALTRFEASSIATVIGFERLLSNIRLTHNLMRRALPHLDAFNTMFVEVNESTSMVSFHGRVVLHVLFEVMGDLCGNFVYNSITRRLVRSPHELSLTPMVRVSMPKNNAQFLYGNRSLSVAFAAVDGLSEKFFGLVHVKAVLRLLGRETLPLVLSEMTKNMALKLKSAMIPITEELAAGLPQRQKITLPFHEYGTEGTYGIFCQSLVNLISYPVMITKVFQMFREWGNSIVLLQMMDTAMIDEGWCQVVQASSFLGTKPQGARVVAVGSSPLEKAFATLNPLSQNSSIKSRDLLGSYIQNVKLINNLYMPAEHNFSIFKATLNEIKKMVCSDWCLNKWTASELEYQEKKTDNPIIPIEATNEFYRIWSAMQFVFCLDIEGNNTMKASSHEIFGDGFFWSGCTIIHLLKQTGRYEVFDYGHVVLRVNEVRSQKLSESMVAFLHRMQQVKDLNDNIFHQLRINAPSEPPLIKKLHPRVAVVSAERPLDHLLTTKSNLPTPVVPVVAPPTLNLPFNPLPPPRARTEPKNSIRGLPSQARGLNSQSVPISSEEPFPFYIPAGQGSAPPLSPSTPTLSSVSAPSTVPMTLLGSPIHGPAPVIPGPAPTIPGPAPSIPGPAPTPHFDLYDLPPAPDIPDYGDAPAPPPPEPAPTLPPDFGFLPDLVGEAPLPPGFPNPTFPSWNTPFPAPTQAPTQAPFPAPTQAPTQAPTPNLEQEEDWDPFGSGNPWPSAPAPQVITTPTIKVRTIVKKGSRLTAAFTAPPPGL